MTNEPIDTVEQVAAIVDAYRARWIVEELFKALKTGCQIEKRQMESYKALRIALALFCAGSSHLLRDDSGKLRDRSVGVDGRALAGLAPSANIPFVAGARRARTCGAW